MSTYDDFIKLISSRTSCRSFKPDHLSDDLIKKVIDAGIWSASAHNSQAVYFIHIKDEEVKRTLRCRTKMIMGIRQESSFDPFYGAPELIVTVAKDTCFAHYDGSIAISHMMDAAHSLGVESCWVNTAQIETTIMHSEIKSICKKAGIDCSIAGVGYLVLGYPSENFVTNVKERIEPRSFSI